MVECLDEKLSVMMRMQMEWILARLYICSVTVLISYVQHKEDIL
jgi:hypothetical protein